MDNNVQIEMLPESNLWELIRNENHQKAFDILYGRYWSDLYKAAFNILKDKEQSLDIVQEIFVWLWEHRHSLVITTSLKGYLSAAVKFKTANLIRHHKIREDFFKQIAAMPAIADPTDANLLLEAKELEDVIRQTINTLPNKCETVYRLSRNEHLSNQEIATKLGISVKTVENQMTIALRRLRMALSQLFMSVILLLVLSAF